MDSKNIILTDAERKKLEGTFKNGYRWIARDKDERIFAYDKKPIKEDDEWMRTNLPAFRLYEEYSFIKWEDDEPTSIEELLNNSKPQEAQEKTPKEWLLTQLAVCTARNGRRFVVLSKENTPVFGNKKQLWSGNLIEDYEEDLTFAFDDEEADIMKIEYNGQVVWERKEPVKITENEKLELMYMQKLGMNYIARDCDNKMYAHDNKPYKSGRYGYWGSVEGKYKKMDLGKYDFIKSTDDEPFSIEELLKANE